MRPILHGFGVVLPILLVAPTSLAWGAIPSIPDSADAGAAIAFNIPAQPLEQALLAYGRIANIQVLYDATLIHGQRSSPVQGLYRVKEALELLLRGTGLRVRYATTNAITLAAIGSAEKDILHIQTMRVQGASELVDRHRMAAYAQSVGDRILATLQSHPATNHMEFDVQLRVWLDAHGGITRTEIVASDVAEKEGAAILAVVHATLPIDAPPADLPQPLAFRFRARAAF